MPDTKKLKVITNNIDHDKIGALLTLTQYKFGEEPKKRAVKKKVPTILCKTCGYKKSPATSIMCHLCNTLL